MVGGIGAAEVDDESCVLGTGHEGYAGANFNAERFVLTATADFGSGLVERSSYPPHKIQIESSRGLYALTNSATVIAM
jgi:hypothetical protein